METSDKPNIIFILADDLGFNDVSFHGSSQIMTPNIDALAFSGMILNNYYVNPICTPSRSALMTGKYPIHTGMQHGVLWSKEPRGLPLNEKLLPEYLRELGYKNHILGKWHLGHFKKEYTPLYRGFDSHLGFWSGHQDYFDHTHMEYNEWGLDMRNQMNISYDYHGQYITDIIRDESVRIIEDHNITNPLFLYISHAAVHTGNEYRLFPAPDSVTKNLSHISDIYRRQFGAMLTKLDESIGYLIEALHQKNILKNSIIIFSTDNGGPSEGFGGNVASNWPLRGMKYSLFEGGVRGAGLLWSPLINKPKRIADQMIHITDWLPTLYRAAGGDVSELNLDGMDLWNELSNDLPSKRLEILHNIDDIVGNSAITYMNHKLVKGSDYNGEWDGWYGPAGDRNLSSYNIDMIINSKTGRILNKLNLFPDKDEIYYLREKSEVSCNVTPEDEIPCEPLISPCLFDLNTDPCEKINLAKKFPDILDELWNKIEEYNKTAIPAANLPMDPKASPKYWNYVWTNFGDFE